MVDTNDRAEEVTCIHFCTLYLTYGIVYTVCSCIHVHVYIDIVRVQ